MLTVLSYSCASRTTARPLATVFEVPFNRARCRRSRRCGDRLVTTKKQGDVMKHEGRGVIRIDDKTDHGGWVIAASSGTVVMGKVAALARHEGRAYAYHGDLTECGARLITSLELTASNSCSFARTKVEQGKEGLPDLSFDDRFVLLDDETGAPAAFVEYAVERENGSVEHGVTNERGETHILSSTTRPEKIRIYVAADI